MMLAFMRLALFAALWAPLAAYAGISYSEAVSKPKGLGYPGGANLSTQSAKIPDASGKDVAESLGKVGANNLLESIGKGKGAEFAQALTTTAVYDGTGNVDLALKYGGNAAGMVKMAFPAKTLLDAGMIIYELGGCVADVIQLGGEKGLRAARDRLYKSKVARPYAIIGEWVGKRIAMIVCRGEKMIANNNKSVTSAAPTSKTIPANKQKASGNTTRSSNYRIASTDKNNSTPTSKTTQTSLFEVVDKSINKANVQSNAVSDIGVRGWCHCWEHEPPWSGARLLVGEANSSTVAEFMGAAYGVTQRCTGKYKYMICSLCGKCVTSQKIGDKYGDIAASEFVDIEIYDKWHDKAGSVISIQEYCRMQQASRDKLLAVPDGQIVIPGKCDCKYPDPVSVALKAEKFYVCCFCGLVRLPDKNGNMPIGPTAKRINETP